MLKEQSRVSAIVGPGDSFDLMTFELGKQTQCYIGAKTGLLAGDPMNRLVLELKKISKMLAGLAKSLKSAE